MIDAKTNEFSLIGGLFSLVEEQGNAAAIKYVMQLEADDFTERLLSNAFSLIKDAVIADHSFDLGIIAGEMQKRFDYGHEVFTELGEVIRNNTSYAAIESHKKAVKQAAVKRKVQQHLMDAFQEMEQSDNPLKTLGALESRIETMMGVASDNQSGFVHLGELMSEWLERADDIIAGKNQEPGLTTGIESLDEVLGEKLILPGSLFVIGANPGSGKTGLMVRMAEGMAVKNPDEQILIYSLEMPNSQIADRFAGLATGNTNPKYFRDEHWGLLSNQLELYKRSNVYCCDNSAVSVSTIKSDCRERAQDGKIACIMVDYLTLMEMPKKDRNDLSVGEVTKQLKRLAKELGCVIVLLCQLSRANMQRANKRPIKSDLRDSGQIEQDSDYILFPYRDSQFNNDSPAGEFAELILDKNRHGATGTPYARFKNGVWYECDQIEAANRCRGSE